VDYPYTKTIGFTAMFYTDVIGILAQMKPKYQVFTQKMSQEQSSNMHESEVCLLE
jgi:hypothetical protein